MSTTKRYKCTFKGLQELWINAASTGEAGKKAAEEYAKDGHVVDEFCVDVEEAPSPRAGGSLSLDPAWIGANGGTLPGMVGAIPDEPITDDEITLDLNPDPDDGFAGDTALSRTIHRSNEDVAKILDALNKTGGLSPAGAKRLWKDIMSYEDFLTKVKKR